MIDFINIKAPWYNKKDEIKTILISGVNSIVSYAFEDCSLVENITIGNTVKSFGINPFRGCSSLTTIEFETYLLYGINFTNNWNRCIYKYECNID